MKCTYREWVEAGARGFFLAPSVAVNATRLINPLDRRGGYFVRRDTSYLGQRERRAALLRDTEREGGERVTTLVTTHVIAYDNAPIHPAHPAHAGDGPSEDAPHVGWILTARVERPAEVVRRGWLMWETLGEVVDGVTERAADRAAARPAARTTEQSAGQSASAGAGGEGEGETDR